MGDQQSLNCAKHDWFALWATAFSVVNAFLMRDCILMRTLETRVGGSGEHHSEWLVTLAMLMVCAQWIFLIATQLRLMWGAYGILLCGTCIVGICALAGLSYALWAPSAIATILFLPAGIWHWRSQETKSRKPTSE